MASACTATKYTSDHMSDAELSEFIANLTLRERETRQSDLNSLNPNAYCELMAALQYENSGALPVGFRVANAAPLPPDRIDFGALVMDGDIEIDSSACAFLVLWAYSRMRLYIEKPIRMFPKSIAGLRASIRSSVDTSVSPNDVRRLAERWDIQITLIEPGLAPKAFGWSTNGSLTICMSAGHCTLVRDPWQESVLPEVLREMTAICGFTYPKFV